jgi:hypothetical protein
MIFLKTKKDKKKHPEDEAICGNVKRKLSIGQVAVSSGSSSRQKSPANCN